MTGGADKKYPSAGGWATTITPCAWANINEGG